MSFTREVFIPFHLGDPAGILFFSHVFTLAHEAYEQFISQSFPISWDDWFKNPERIIPIKQAEANYSHPLVVGQPCLITLDVKEARTSSFSLEYKFIQNNIECCTVKTLHIFCDGRTKLKQPLPEAIKKILISGIS